jgi:hypothetical protein
LIILANRLQPLDRTHAQVPEALEFLPTEHPPSQAIPDGTSLRVWGAAGTESVRKMELEDLAAASSRDERRRRSLMTHHVASTSKLDDALRGLVRDVVREEIATAQLGIRRSGNAAPPEVKFLDDKTLASRTAIARISWQVWRAKGKGPPHYRVGRRCLYKWHEVVEWLEGRRGEGKASSILCRKSRGA